MARWASTCVLGGVVFSGCRVELIDAGGFKSPLAGSIDWGNDGSPDVQTINRGVKGIPFGLRMKSAEGTDLTDLFAAIDAAGSAGIAMEIVDGIFNLDILGGPDYSQEWFLWEKHSEGWYEGVTLRFVSKAAAP